LLVFLIIRAASIEIEGRTASRQVLQEASLD
jgi:hypothetical protein